ncbi:hypothetical protein JCM17823_10730 [Halorubrum gandharaense]
MSHPRALQQLTHIPLDIQDPTCQVCKQPLQEGDDITAYAYRAAGDPTFAIGYIMCGADSHEHPTVFTHGVDEYVLTGHVGTCTNSQTQSTTFVLLSPSAVVTSSTRTTDPHIREGADTPREPTTPQREEPPSLLSAVRTRSDGGQPREDPR